MNALILYLKNKRKIIYGLLLALCMFPFISPPIALFIGLIFALVCDEAFPRFNKKSSKYVLQFSVVGLGFGMNIQQALVSGKEGMAFTIISVVGTLLIGSAIAWRMKINTKTGFLISSGTAICGGSAIAAIGPVIRADESQMSVSLGTIFILNAIALFVFPSLGSYFGLTQHQFGLWSAIAIHDTSSVVGASAAYGAEALKVATTVKLTRALWIIPIAFATSFVFKSKSNKIYIPWFILLFVLAMVVNTFLPLPPNLTNGIVWLARKGLTVTLFFIGASLSKDVLRNVGIYPMMQGVILWLIISLVSLLYILFRT